MTKKNKNVPIRVRFCFKRNEFVIHFDESQSASDYQRRNPERRIFADESSKDVYLPLPSSMASLRASSNTEFSFVIRFYSEGAASSWSSKSGLGSVSADDDLDVYIRRDVKKVRGSRLRIQDSRSD